MVCAATEPAILPFLCSYRACNPSLEAQLCPWLLAALEGEMLVVPLRASCPLTVKNHRVRSPRDTSACRAPPAEGSHIQLRSVAQPLTHELGSPRDKRVRDLYSWRPWGKAWQQLKLTDSIWKQSPSRDMERGKQTGSG